MILSVEGLDFKYPSHNVLKDISFTLEKGECLAILGTNGAGKSTLLKCINKILKPLQGSIIIDKNNLKKLKQTDIAKKVAYVSQNNQGARMTVFDSILIGRRPYIKWDVTKKDINIVNKTIQMLELEDYSLRFVDELSGGEYQKVLVGRALAQEPKVLLLDEPTSNLDLKNQLEVINIIKKVIKENNISAIVTIHDLNLALRFADKFILLKNGKVFASGKKEIINPENIKVVYSVNVNVERFNNFPVVIPV